MERHPRTCLTLVFRGRVQGVGFRHTVAQLAASFPVAGTVENVPDGTVKMVVEGAKDAVEAFAEAVRLKMDRYIRGEDESWTEPTGLHGFRIAH